MAPNEIQLSPATDLTSAESAESTPAVLTGLWFTPPGTDEKFAIVYCGDGMMAGAFIEEALLPDPAGPDPTIECPRCDRKHELIGVLEAVEHGWMTTTEMTDRESVSVDVLELVMLEVASMQRRLKEAEPGKAHRAA